MCCSISSSCISNFTPSFSTVNATTGFKRQVLLALNINEPWLLMNSNRGKPVVIVYVAGISYLVQIIGHIKIHRKKMILKFTNVSSFSPCRILIQRLLKLTIHWTHTMKNLVILHNRTKQISHYLLYPAFFSSMKTTLSL